jgi:hypothetical protein
MPAATSIGDSKRALSASLVQRGAASSIAQTAIVNQMLDVNYEYNKIAVDGAAATNTADTLVWTNPYDFPVYVVSGKYVGVGAGLTADPTNFATIAFKTNDGAGGATATALSVATTVADGGTWTSNQSKSFTAVTLANTAIPAGGGLWINITKSGTGVVVPISNYVIRMQKGE